MTIFMSDHNCAFESEDKNTKSDHPIAAASDNKDGLSAIALSDVPYASYGASTKVTPSMSSRIVKNVKKIGSMVKNTAIMCCCGVAAFQADAFEVISDEQSPPTACVAEGNANPFEEGLNFCDRVDLLVAEALARELEVLEQLKCLENDGCNPDK